MDKLQLSQALMRKQKSTGGRLHDQRRVLQLKGHRFDPRNSQCASINSSFCCEVSSSKCLHFNIRFNVVLLNILYPICSGFKPKLLKMFSIKNVDSCYERHERSPHCPLLLFFGLQSRFSVHFRNPILTIQAAPAYARCYLARRSRRVGVIQTFFKLQFIFPEL